MKVEVIIPAGGTGRRVGGEVPKQYMPLGGVHMLVHTLRVFQRMGDRVDRMVLLVPEGDVTFVREVIVGGYGLSKVGLVLVGGKERQDSVKRGLDALGEAEAEDDVVVVHDAVRPFVTVEQVSRAVEQCSSHGAVTLAVPVKDTVKDVGIDGLVVDTLRRDGLWLTQTPQAFKKMVLREAYRRAYEENFYGTDDAVLVERMGIPVKVVPGSYENIKITTQEDLEYADYLINRRKA